MAKRYIVTEDMIDSAIVANSANAVQSKVIQTELAKKLDKAGTASDLNKVPMIKETGAGTGVYELALTAIPEAAQSDWNETDTTSQAFILNKPFKTIGAGLKVESDALIADPAFKFQIFTTLPAAAEAYKATIGLIANGGTGTNIYDEYVCVSDTTVTPATWAWEKLGTLDFTMTQTASAITINGNTVQTATDTQIGLMSAADHVTLTGAQAKSNLVTAFQATVDDTHYPSEKLVKDSLDLKQLTANLTTTIAAAASASDTKYPSEKAVRTNLDLKQDVANLVTAFSSTLTDTKYPSEKLVKNSLDGKVDIDFGTGATALTTLACGREEVGGVVKYFLDDGA